MRARDGILITLMAVAMLVLFPLWIPVAMVVVAVDRRRLQKVARSFVCVECGNPLGPASLKLADGVWDEHVRELMRKYPHVKFRMVRTCHAICATCGTRYTFQERERTFTIEARPPAGVEA